MFINCFHFRFALLVFVRETLGGEGLFPLLYIYQLHVLYKLYKVRVVVVNILRYLHVTKVYSPILNQVSR